MRFYIEKKCLYYWGKAGKVPSYTYPVKKYIKLFATVWFISMRTTGTCTNSAAGYDHTYEPLTLRWQGFDSEHCEPSIYIRICGGSVSNRRPNFP